MIRSIHKVCFTSNMSKQENKTKTAVSQKSYCTADDEEAIPTPLVRELDCLLLGFPKLWKRCNGE